MEEFLRKIEQSGISTNSDLYKSLYDISLLLEYNNVSDENIEVISQLLVSDEISQLKTPTSWVEFDYGNVKIGSIVKVKDDAYSSDTGKVHNGRVGFLLDISGRRCLVRYAGTRGKSDMRHPMTNLLSPKYGVEWID